jgi:hypothetical protein
MNYGAKHEHEVSKDKVRKKDETRTIVIMAAKLWGIFAFRSLMNLRGIISQRFSLFSGIVHACPNTLGNVKLLEVLFVLRKCLYGPDARSLSHRETVLACSSTHS